MDYVSYKLFLIKHNACIEPVKYSQRSGRRGWYGLPTKASKRVDSFHFDFLSRRRPFTFTFRFQISDFSFGFIYCLHHRHRARCAKTGFKTRSAVLNPTLPFLLVPTKIAWFCCLEADRFSVSASFSCILPWKADIKAEVDLMTESKIDFLIPLLQMNNGFRWHPWILMTGWH